jgi:hypothetical protein
MCARTIQIGIDEAHGPACSESVRCLAETDPANVTIPAECVSSFSRAYPFGYFFPSTRGLRRRNTK